MLAHDIPIMDGTKLSGMPTIQAFVNIIPSRHLITRTLQGTSQITPFLTINEKKISTIKQKTTKTFTIVYKYNTRIFSFVVFHILPTLISYPLTKSDMVT